MINSRIPGFYKKGVEQRRAEIAGQTGLTPGEVASITTGGLDDGKADQMIENVIGQFSLPLGVATNFTINGKDVLVPMATEEPSVIAAASNAARMARKTGGFKAGSGKPLMIGQVQVIGGKPGSIEEIHARRSELIEIANQQDPVLVKFGGGAVDVKARAIDTQAGKMIVVHLIVDVRDAMGANAVNTMCEAIAPLIEELTSGKTVLKILTNYADKRIVTASTVFLKDDLGGPEIVERIMLAYQLAENDVYRAVTHNKGVMNGISAVVRATGNDTRAVEAGCHAYATRSGAYKSLTRYEVNSEGDLEASIEIPVATGIIGGATKSHPVAQAALKIIGIDSAQGLAEVIASVGLAQNLAALRALADEGIQEGHMKLHAKNIAVMAGASGKDAETIAEKMIEAGTLRVDVAKTLLEKYPR
ncbi:hydroxymethylglutaryl-CoA reductase, degradative [Candidatus Altiarchaeota archaeon]